MIPYEKYYEGRRHLEGRGLSLSSKAQHLYAKFYAESDWDDPHAAWAEFQRTSSGAYL